MSTNVDDIIERLRGRTLTSEDAQAVIAMVRSRTTADEVPTGDPLRDVAIERFFTASEHEDVVALRDRIVDLGTEIDRRVPAGRNKALALTALEDVQMRGNRGLFAPEHLR
ncbi:hypothetical protein [Curtobacterium sp. MCBA15_012]|uniref:Acb2/Tad1 domain-containing protein n=1 Tax=Curtobacterium sp. MCBA15_012 TaxID=1898738 RepID=UPI0008DE4810|nr:hypothetical protein [Curtobacterium sp. MCBA15_012]WIA99737.1 hypothetical protein QOL15_14680 [Curtobacterium sp. MCBA15_012]